jgi:hypothetical protein
LDLAVVLPLPECGIRFFKVHQRRGAAYPELLSSSGMNF